jgi:hypothetical protein
MASPDAKLLEHTLRIHESCAIETINNVLLYSVMNDFTLGIRC